MTDKELLALAAKAAGMLPTPPSKEWDYTLNGGLAFCGGGEFVEWNPLTDDGDALRLAVKLGIVIDLRYTKPEVRKYNATHYWLPGKESRGWSSVEFDLHEDPFAATRRAIVKAAAQMAGSAPPLTAQSTKE
jgi:hypothetical protein